MNVNTTVRPNDARTLRSGAHRADDQCREDLRARLSHSMVLT